MLLRELVRSNGWKIAESTPSMDRAIELLKTGHAFMLICDDSQQTPVTRYVRHSLTDSVSLCTPTLAFLGESHKGETRALERMGRPFIAEKPLTPSKFLPAFSGLIKAWEKDSLLALRRANYLFIDGQDAQGFKALARLMGDPSIGPLACQALALQLRNATKIKEAETLLLKSLQKAPREMGTLLALSDLYLQAAMPKVAHQLLKAARGTFANALAMLPDLIQAELMLGLVEEAIVNLSTLVKAGENDEQTLDFLARLLFAQGRDGEAEKLLADAKAVFKRLQAAWQQADGQALGAAS